MHTLHNSTTANNYQTNFLSHWLLCAGLTSDPLSKSRQLTAAHVVLHKVTAPRHVEQHAAQHQCCHGNDEKYDGVTLGAVG